MPFTPSHAVLALPFLRTPLIPAAIAIGAMTPDLPLFTRNLPVPYPRTHDLLWLPVTMVLALVLLLIWRCVLRPAARELAPRWLAARLPEGWDSNARASLRETLPPRAGAIVLLASSLALGVASHILWDQFTHEGRWGVQLIPALGQQWGPLTGYKWLQHGSSAIGLAILGVWMIVWLSRRVAAAPIARVVSNGVRWAWWLSLPILLVAGWLWGLAVFGPITHEWTIAHLAYRVLPPACGIWGAVTLGLCIAVQWRRRRITR